MSDEVRVQELKCQNVHCHNHSLGGCDLSYSYQKQCISFLIAFETRAPDKAAEAEDRLYRAYKQRDDALAENADLKRKLEVARDWLYTELVRCGGFDCDDLRTAIEASEVQGG